MNCFYHQDTIALGVCKNCNKGICNNCITEVPNGIACSAICAEELKQVDVIVQRSKTSYTKTATAYYRSAFVYFALGLIFVLVGLFLAELIFFLIPAGIIFIIAAALAVNTGNKFKKPPSGQA